VPLLARMVPSPLSVDIRRGAVEGLAALLRDQRISSRGQVAVVVGPGQGEQIIAVVRPAFQNAAVYPVEGGTVEAAIELADSLRAGSYDAVVGIGGGRTLDVAKYAASLTGLPMVAVATSLAHDGIASPVASLDHDGHKGSHGVNVPIAVVVDLDKIPPFTDSKKVNAAIKDYAKMLLADSMVTNFYQKIGTMGMADLQNALGGLPVRNFSAGRLADVAAGEKFKMGGDHISQLNVSRGGEHTHACMPGCVIQCSNVYVDASGKEVVSPVEYETLGLLGTNCGLSDPDDLAQMNFLANDLGVDTIELGATLARRLAGILSAMLRDGTTYAPGVVSRRAAEAAVPV